MADTEYYNLKKPSYLETADVGDMNDNMDIIDGALHDKLDAANVYNGLDKTAAGFALDARQGKVLNDKIVSYKNDTSTIAELKTGLLAFVNTLSVNDVRNYSFWTSGSMEAPFSIGQLYAGDITVTSKSSNTSRFSAVFSCDNGTPVSVGYNAGTWKIEELALNSNINRRNIQKSVFSQLDNSGNTSLDTLSAYPTTTGVFRVGNPSNCPGLPSGSNGYGPLMIFNAGSYVLHIHRANNNRMWYGSSSNSPISAPANWTEFAQNNDQVQYANNQTKGMPATAGTGVTIDTTVAYSRAVKRNGIIYLQLRMQIPSGISDDTVIATLHSDLKPIVDLSYLPCFNLWDRTISGCMTVSSTDGKIRANHDCAGKNLSLIITYPAMSY